MPKFYPHKQTVIIFIVCTLAVGGVAAYTFGHSPQKNPINNTVIVDTTSQKNPEIATNSNWQKDFIDSGIADTKKIVKTQTATVSKPLTATDTFGRAFFAKYIQLKQNGLEGDTNSVNNAISETIDETVAATPGPKDHTSAELKITQDTSVAALHAYGNAVGAIMRNFPTQNPLKVTADMINNDDTTLKAQLDAITAAYEFMEANLPKIPTPQPLVISHIELMNSIGGMYYISDGLRKNTVDPTKTLVGLSMYKSVTENLLEALTDIEDYLKKNNVSFSSTESGSLLVDNSH